MDNYVITIAREYGSGGKTIGKMLADHLGIPCYDMEILRMASDDSGINEQLFAKSDEQLKRPIFFKPSRSVYTDELIPPGSKNFVSEENLFNYQAKIIKILADKESCVIIGRCADFVLKDRPNVLKVYVHAPFENCVKTTMEIRNLDQAEAEKFVRKVDKRRGDYYRYFTGRDWKDADNYDLCLDSATLGWEKCMQIVKAYLEIKMS